MEQQFTATIEQAGKQVILPIPFDPNKLWGQKERHDVAGTIDGIKIRGPLRLKGSQYLLTLGSAWRRDCGIVVGMSVTVFLEPEGPQIGKMAEDLQSAFGAAPAATAFFNTLPTFYRKNYMRWIESAKRPETRAQRIAQMIELLIAEKRER